MHPCCLVPQAMMQAKIIFASEASIIELLVSISEREMSQGQEIFAASEHDICEQSKPH